LLSQQLAHNLVFTLGTLAYPAVVHTQFLRPGDGMTASGFFRHATLVTATGLATVAGLGVPAVAEAPTFQQVLASPDDPEINLAYARQEAADGNLLSAAAALERVLLAHPNAHSVRLFYVAVLYRLNDLQGAKDQIRQLEGVHLSPLQSAEREKYRHLVEHGQSTTKITGDVVAGLDFETDSIGSVLDEVVDFSGHHPIKNGLAAIGAGDVFLSSDFGPNGDYNLLASAQIYTRSTLAGPQTNFQMGTFNLGVGGSSLHSSWQVTGVFNDYMIFDDPYLIEYGANAQATWHQSPWITWNASAQFVGQSYHEDEIFIFNPSFETIDDPHQGARFTVQAGGTFRLDAYSQFSAAVGYEGKWARYRPYGYDAAFVNADYHVLLGRGVYGDLSGDLRFVGYRGKDQLLFDIERQDVRDDARLAFGAPLSAFADEGSTGDWRENVIVEESVSYADRTTRLPVAPFSSVGAEFRVIWQFGS
jgi:hypothetical protein